MQILPLCPPITNRKRANIKTRSYFAGGLIIWAAPLSLTISVEKKDGNDQEARKVRRNEAARAAMSLDLTHSNNVGNSLKHVWNATQPVNNCRRQSKTTLATPEPTLPNMPSRAQKNFTRFTPTLPLTSIQKKHHMWR